MSLPFTHLVLVDGEPIRKFRSLREAKWFTEGKHDATIEKLQVEKEKPIWEVFTEPAPF